MWWKRFINQEANIVLRSPWRDSILGWLKFDDFTLCNSHPDRIAAYRTLLEISLAEANSGEHLPKWLATIAASTSSEAERQAAASSIGEWLETMRQKPHTRKWIEPLKERFDDYESRREMAFNRLFRLILPDSFKTAVIRSHVPYHYVPHGIFMGRLHGFGLIAKDSLASFLDGEFGEFWKMERHQQEEFLGAYHKAKDASAPGGSQFAILKVWIDDNMPVFQRFHWDWAGINEYALKAGFSEDEDLPSDLADWAADHNRSSKGTPSAAKWHLTTKRRRANPREIARSAILLTPRPRIAAGLHPESVPGS